MVRVGDRVKVCEPGMTGTVVRVYSVVKGIVLDEPAIVVRFDERLPNGDGYDVVKPADIKPVVSVVPAGAIR